MSKKVKRLPGDEPPPDPERGRRILELKPLRAVDTWRVSESSGRVVLTHSKGLRPIEQKLARALKGPTTVNRQLDEFGSLIWTLCDGDHTVEQIARALEERYHERFEPALPRTLRFVELLARGRLVTIAREPAAHEGGPDE